jgi:hypothetical protein
VVSARPFVTLREVSLVFDGPPEYLRSMKLIAKSVAIGLALVVLFAAPSLAQSSGGYVTGGVIERDPQTPEVGPADPADPNAQVLGVNLERGDDDPALPVTGGDAVGLAVLATMLIMAGGAVVAVTRTRRVTAA